MLVYKFGGASIKDAASIRSLLPLIEKRKSEKLILVISAMGKMTNALELLLAFYRKEDTEKLNQLDKIKAFHFAILEELFEKDHPVYKSVQNYFMQLEQKLEEVSMQTYDYAYDQTVCYGELISSLILSEFLKLKGFKNNNLDASDFIITNDKYRDARVDFVETRKEISKRLKPEFEKQNLIVTQGFIGGTEKGSRTTIGREGSDYSAAILAHCLDASELTVWKDVPGILNADPKLLSNARNLEHISYHETVELAFYGAAVIHPRTLQPLKAKQIPLFIRSFSDPDLYSLIDGNSLTDSKIPSFIMKENQILFTISARDFSFIDAEKLAGILKLFSEHHFHIRLIQNSALNFSLLADENPLKLEELINQLKEDYIVKYNRNLSLLTVRHMNSDHLSNLFDDTELLLEMHNRMTDQFVMYAKDLNFKLMEINKLI